MFPHIHYQQRVEPCDISYLVQRYPVVRQPAIGGIFITDNPAYAAHLSSPNEIGFPDVITLKAELSRLKKARVSLGFR